MPRIDLKNFLRPELVATWREITGVLLVFLAPFAIASAWAASRGSQGRYIQHFLSNRALLLNGVVEAAFLGLLLVFLHWRGWKPADLRIRPSVGSTLLGLPLLPLTLFANGLVVFSASFVLYLTQHRYANFIQFLIADSPQLHHLHAGQLSWFVLASTMLLNAFLEEITCTAYAFNQFAARLGPFRGLILVVILRTACHTYQGGVHALGLSTAFLIYGLIYWRTRNLWLLIFAHAFLDFSSFAALKFISP